MVEHFFKYREVSWNIIMKVLRSFGFEPPTTAGEEDNYLRFRMGDKFVHVPKENRIPSLTLGEIIDISGIDKTEFLAKLENLTVTES